MSQLPSPERLVQQSVVVLSAGQKLWPLRTHQVHPPGGPGHHVLRLGLGPGERPEQQVLQAEGGGREGRVRQAHHQEEEALRHVCVCVCVEGTRDCPEAEPRPPQTRGARSWLWREKETRSITMVLLT